MRGLERGFDGGCGKSRLRNGEGGVGGLYRALSMAILGIRIREGWKQPWKLSKILERWDLGGYISCTSKGVPTIITDLIITWQEHLYVCSR